VREPLTLTERGLHRGQDGFGKPGFAQSVKQRAGPLLAQLLEPLVELLPGELGRSRAVDRGESVHQRALKDVGEVGRQAVVGEHVFHEFVVGLILHAAILSDPAAWAEQPANRDTWEVGTARNARRPSHLRTNAWSLG